MAAALVAIGILTNSAASGHLSSSDLEISSSIRRSSSQLPRRAGEPKRPSERPRSECSSFPAPTTISIPSRFIHIRLGPIRSRASTTQETSRSLRPILVPWVI